MAKRSYTVTVSGDEAARLRAFDNAAHGLRPWPLGPNRSFMRRNATTFVVKHWVTMGVGRAAVMTLGRATLRGNQVDVSIRTKNSWIGWLLIAAGLVCLAVTPRDGFWAAVLGVGLVLAGWYLYLRRSDHLLDLEEVEKVMRRAIAGDWVLVDGVPPSADAQSSGS